MREMTTKGIEKKCMEGTIKYVGMLLGDADLEQLHYNRGRATGYSLIGSWIQHGDDLDLVEEKIRRDLERLASKIRHSQTADDMEYREGIRASEVQALHWIREGK